MQSDSLEEFAQMMKNNNKVYLFIQNNYILNILNETYNHLDFLLFNIKTCTEIISHWINKENFEKKSKIHFVLRIFSMNVLLGIG